jgi:hypothetical protein
MKDRNAVLRRTGRGRLVARIRLGRRGDLAELFDQDDGAVRFKQNQPTKRLTEKNWRIKREGSEVLAIEPGWAYETPFRGDSALMDAIEFAAAELRKADADEDA